MATVLSIGFAFPAIAQKSDSSRTKVYQEERLPESVLDGFVSNFIRKSLVMPEAVRKGKISGRVLIRFTITSDGLVEHSEVIKGLSPACDEAALMAVASLPRLKPATLNGNPISCPITIPVVFDRSASR